MRKSISRRMVTPSLMTFNSECWSTSLALTASELTEKIMRLRDTPVYLIRITQDTPQLLSLMNKKKRYFDIPNVRDIYQLKPFKNEK